MLHTQYLEVQARPVCWTKVGCSLTHAVTGQGDQFDLIDLGRHFQDHRCDCPVQNCCFSLNLRIQASWLNLGKYIFFWLLVAFMVWFFAPGQKTPSKVCFVFPISAKPWCFCMVNWTGCFVKVCYVQNETSLLSAEISDFALQRVHGCIDDHPHFDSGRLWPSSVRSRPCSSHCMLDLPPHVRTQQLSRSDNVNNVVVYFDARNWFGSLPNHDEFCIFDVWFCLKYICMSYADM